MDKRLTKAERLLAVAFVGVLLFFMGSILCVYLMGKMGKGPVADTLESAEAISNRKEIEKEIEIDWQKLYPFTEEQLKQDIQAVPNAVKPLPERFFSYLKNWVNVYAKDHLVARLFWVKNAKLYEKFIHWNMASMSEYNGVVTLPDGYLTGLVEKRDVSESVKSTVELANFCKQRGIDFLYVNAPYKICKFEDAGISGKLDFSNQNADEFLKRIGEAGVKYYDLREVLHNEGLSHHGAFFRTDHHWRPETGLWASRHILQYLRDEYGYPVDPSVLEEDRFTAVNYPSWFLGSQGKKVTLERAKPDDISLIYPKYPTSFHYQIPNLDLDVSGGFSITYDMSHIKELDYYNKSPYSAYDYADQPVIRIENQRLEGNIKLLVIHDSFANCVIPFLALEVPNVEAVDVRHFTGSVQNYITATKPDIVIVLYSANAITGDIDWQSHESLFDFR